MPYALVPYAFGIFTTVKSPLQIRPFMQNEPNSRKSQMNVNNLLTRDYEKRTLGERGKNEPKTNPIYPCVASGEAGSKPIKANKMLPRLTINGLRKTVLIFYVKSSFTSDAPEHAVLFTQYAIRYKIYEIC